MATSTEIGVVAISTSLQNAFGNGGQFPRSIYDNLARAIMQGVELYVEARLVEVKAEIAAASAAKAT